MNVPGRVGKAALFSAMKEQDKGGVTCLVWEGGWKKSRRDHGDTGKRMSFRDRDSKCSLSCEKRLVCALIRQHAVHRAGLAAIPRLCEQVLAVRSCSPQNIVRTECEKAQKEVN